LQGISFQFLCRAESSGVQSLITSAISLAAVLRVVQFLNSTIADCSARILATSCTIAMNLQDEACETEHR
jgi:hypothetical protein